MALPPWWRCSAGSFSDQIASHSGRQPQQIARVAIEGAITEDREQLELLKRVAAADHVRGLVVYINSPGGTTTGGESLYEALRKIAEKKPVVAQFGTLATSAGYIAGLGTDYIVARGNTVTGSVGVLVQWPEVDQLLEKLGVKMNIVKSGPLKATPNPFEPIDEEVPQGHAGHDRGELQVVRFAGGRPAQG